jgi:hypothetical protein
MEDDDKVMHPREDDGNEELEESPVPDPTEKRAAEADDPEAD